MTADVFGQGMRDRGRRGNLGPDLAATAVDAEPIMDSLSTVFSEIKPVN